MPPSCVRSYDDGKCAACKRDFVRVPTFRNGAMHIGWLFEQGILLGKACAARTAIHCVLIAWFMRMHIE
jgi:hypothetical protein